MIDGRILRLTPKRVFCPLCGKWHDQENKEKIPRGSYRSKGIKYECNGMYVSFFVTIKIVIIEVNNRCASLTKNIRWTCSLEDIAYDSENKSTIRGNFHISTDCNLNSPIFCERCKYKTNCNFISTAKRIAKGPEGSILHIDIPFKIEYESSEFEPYSFANFKKREEDKKKIKEEEKTTKILAIAKEGEESKNQIEPARQRIAINRNILKLTPTQVFCPLCGKWHKLDYIDIGKKYYKCNGRVIEMSFSPKSIGINMKKDIVGLYCDKFPKETLIWEGPKNIFYDDETKPIVAIPFNLTSKQTICRDNCEECEYYSDCNFVKINACRDPKSNQNFFDLKFRFKYRSEQFKQYSLKAMKEREREEKECKEKKQVETMETRPIKAWKIPKTWYLKH